MKYKWFPILVLMGGGLPGFAGTAEESLQAAQSRELRCCITPPHRYYQDSPEVVRKRMDFYKELGVEMLRLESPWSLLETQEGVWDGAQYRPYFDEVKNSGFRIKMIVGTIMAPPGWFLAKHPDARLVNEDGAMSVNTLNFWYPNLHEEIARATTGMFEWLRREGMLDRIDLVCVDFGPAGEPIYPAAWTQPGQKGEKFWFYSENAQADFRLKMKEKYGTLNALNRKWGKDFKGWDEVVVPRPGSCPGACWEDVLVWYRDTKREFIEWQVDNFREHLSRFSGNRIKLVVYVPGSDVHPEQWKAAVASGAGDAAIRLMFDSKFLLELAGRKGCQLQYTGVSERAEVERLRKYLDENGLSDVPMWGENAGYWDCAKDPLNLADIIIRNRLYGLDFTHSHFVFANQSGKPVWEEEEGSHKKTVQEDVMLNPAVAGPLKEAYHMIRQAHETPNQ